MLEIRPRECPICGDQRPEVVGEILHPFPAKVADVIIDLQDLRFFLVRCSKCSFQYKDPPIPQEALLKCYEHTEDGHLGEDVDPYFRCFDIIADLLRRHAPGKCVLDIGCFNGSLLSFLGQDWQRFGIEPSRAATVIAKERGIGILGRTIEELPNNIEPFDAITVIDVLEHLPDPVGFFTRIHSLLKPGGVLLAVTADTGSLHWHMLNCRYWYCSLPGHVGFFSRETMQFIGSKLGWEMREFQRLRHERAKFYGRTMEMAKNVGYWIGWKCCGFGLPLIRRFVIERRAPGWVSAKDHMYVVMRRSVPSPDGL
ncbi:MAG TPA: class I SAM-dependent methyltransferase [Tepidisphaeraceae bacterium]|nr:class I SAM-dependent methyltransferase [Tepidisphaeraceae bacterium]